VFTKTALALANLVGIAVHALAANKQNSSTPNWTRTTAEACLSAQTLKYSLIALRAACATA
jgi:hypothetical protein